MGEVLVPRMVSLWDIMVEKMVLESCFKWRMKYARVGNEFGKVRLK